MSRTLLFAYCGLVVASGVSRGKAQVLPPLLLSGAMAFLLTLHDIKYSLRSRYHALPILGWMVWYAHTQLLGVPYSSPLVSNHTRESSVEEVVMPWNISREGAWPLGVASSSSPLGFASSSRMASMCLGLWCGLGIEARLRGGHARARVILLTPLLLLIIPPEDYPHRVAQTILYSLCALWLTTLMDSRRRPVKVYTYPLALQWLLYPPSGAALPLWTLCATGWATWLWGLVYVRGAWGGEKRREGVGVGVAHRASRAVHNPFWSVINRE